MSLPDSVRNYLFKAFRFYIFDKMALKKNLTLEELDDSVDFFLEPASDPEIIKEEIAEEGRQKLARALSKLTPRQREAIYLRYQQGLSYPEISAILSLTQKAAYKLIGRAIQVLRESNGLMLLISGVSVMVAI